MTPNKTGPGGELKSGLAVVAGRPNVGKSTLVNALVGEKVSITSRRPQTTRFVSRGVLNVYRRDGEGGASAPMSQVILVDTPGLHKPRTALGERLNGAVYRALSEADCALAVFDVSARIGPGDRMTADRLREDIPPERVVAVLNKTDKTGKEQVAERLAQAALWDFGAYVPVSARTGDGLERVVDEVVSRLPAGPAFFPEGQVGDQPPEVMVSEIIREKLLGRLRDELPHSVAVVSELEETGGGKGGGKLLRVEAVIYVERNSQKGIVIGAGGSLLKEAGILARRELESRLGRKIFLDLRVKVERDWQSRPEIMERLGL